MRALVLWADDGSANLGVRALAHGVAAVLRSVAPDAHVDFQHYGRGPSPHPIRTPRGLLRERVTGRHGLMEWLSTYDVVLDTRAGDSFSDIYGLRRLTTLTLTAELAAQAGVPVVLTPQTVGPFGTRRGRLLAKRSLRRSTVVMARDSVSAAHAAELGRPVDVLSTDVVFALPVPEVERTRDVVLNVSGLLWQPSPHVDSAGYRRTIAGVVEGLRAQGREVSFLAHVLSAATPSPDDDEPVAAELARELAPGAEVLVPTSLDEVRRMVASAELVIGSRMHACLNALSTGTPAVPLAYSRKFQPLLADLGWEHTIDLRTHPDPVGAVLERATAHDELRRATTTVQARAAELLRPAAEALAALVPEPAGDRA